MMLQNRFTGSNLLPDLSVGCTSDHIQGFGSVWSLLYPNLNLDRCAFSEGVAKPSNVRGSSHKKHKKHKILVPLVARSRSYSRFCNILFQGGESIFPCPVSLSNWATRPCARGYSLAPLRGSIRMRLRR